jgi:hypothetical protein
MLRQYKVEQIFLLVEKKVVGSFLLLQVSVEMEYRMGEVHR